MLIVMTLASGGPAWARAPEADLQAGAPVLSFALPERQATLGAVYRSALDNLLQVNTVPVPRGKGAAYNQTGLLSRRPGTFFRAGGGYHQPWTRDASINSWSAGSLLAPEAARQTLWSVVRRQSNGKLIVQQDNQWWDQTIWVVAAWNHFLVTGDRKFLTQAYGAAQQTLERDRELHFNQEHGLFQGAAFLNDGIAGYPAPPADDTESLGSFVLTYPGATQLMVLSTNCIYVGAYRAAAAMAEELHRPAGEGAFFTASADTLVSRIRQEFWLPGKGRFGYLLEPDGTLDPSQEGAGSAFSVLFDVAAPEQASSILRVVEEQPYGLPDVWPTFPRYHAAQPGRHNNIVWPAIEGLWAEAAAQQKNETVFAHEVETLAGLAARDRNHFWEIYDGNRGLPSGGWQTRHLWYSEPNQTWSATAYLRMMYAGLFGMRFGVDGLHFAPLLPAGWGDVSLHGLHYRAAFLNVQLRGAGAVVKTTKVDGVLQAEPKIAAGLRGTHTIELEMGTA